MQNKYLISTLVLVIGLFAISACMFFFEKGKSSIILYPYACAGAEARASGADGSNCEDHVFPSRKQVLDYFNDSTFKRLNDDAGYTVRYFHGEKGKEIDGHYREIALKVEGRAESSVTADHGPWWLRDVIIPMKSDKAVVNRKAQALCTHDKYWEPPRNDNGDDNNVEDVYAYCDIVWDLSGKFLYGKSYHQDATWAKVASNDVFDLTNVVQSYSPDFTIQGREGLAGGDSSLSPIKLVDLIKAKNKETYDKMYKPQ